MSLFLIDCNIIDWIIPWWICGAIAALVVYGAWSTVQKVRARLRG